MIVEKTVLFCKLDHIDKFYFIRFYPVFDFIWIYEINIVALENCDFSRTTNFTNYLECQINSENSEILNRDYCMCLVFSVLILKIYDKNMIL